MAKYGSVPGPLVIGGVGGSGTRVVAQMMLDLGFYLGGDLNDANDNLWFTLLFKRPRWFRQVESPDSPPIQAHLSLLERAMTGGRLTAADWPLALRALPEVSGQEIRSGGPLWTARRVWTLLRTEQVDLSTMSGWGWKEPNSHIYLGYLHTHFPDLKYLHLIRHGLDMAFSGNQNQLRNWGWQFGISMPKSPEQRPKASLDYWIQSNHSVIEQGQTLLGARFLALNFDDLCLNPQAGVEKLLDFLGLPVSAEARQHLASLPKAPRSTARYKQYGLDSFDPAQIEAVRALGFSVD